MTAENAEQHCINTFGTHLATILSADDNQRAQSECMIHPNTTKLYAAGCTIGLNDRSNERYNSSTGWTWFSLATVSYYNWAPTEPNAWPGFIGGEDCVLIWKATGLWNDIPCDGQGRYNQYFLCDEPPTTSPSIPPPTHNPSKSPTRSPSVPPPTRNPSASPTLSPSVLPTTRFPSASPTRSPSDNPSALPTKSPSFTPTHAPLSNPSISPTQDPSISPTKFPSDDPSTSPMVQPSVEAGTPTKTPTPAPTNLIEGNVDVDGSPTQTPTPGAIRKDQSEEQNDSSWIYTVVIIAGICLLTATAVWMLRRLQKIKHNETVESDLELATNDNVAHNQSKRTPNVEDDVELQDEAENASQRRYSHSSVLYDEKRVTKGAMIRTKGEEEPHQSVYDAERNEGEQSIVETAKYENEEITMGSTEHGTTKESPGQEEVRV